MNIILSPSLSIETYGLGISVFQTFQALLKNGNSIKVITSDPKFRKNAKNSQENVLFAKSFLPYPFTYSNKIYDYLIQNKASLIDLQGLWTPFSWILTNYYLEKKIPYIITPHGMLDSYGVSNMGIKKKLAYYMFEEKCLKNAKAFRVTSSRELNNLRAFGIKQPIAVIPHGIDSLKPFKKKIIEKKISKV